MGVLFSGKTTFKTPLLGSSTTLFTIPAADPAGITGPITYGNQPILIFAYAGLNGLARTQSAGFYSFNSTSLGSSFQNSNTFYAALTFINRYSVQCWAEVILSKSWFINLDLGGTFSVSFGSSGSLPTDNFKKLILSGTITKDWVHTAASGTISATFSSSTVSVVGSGTRFLTEIHDIIDSWSSGNITYVENNSANTITVLAQQVTSTAPALQMVWYVTWVSFVASGGVTANNLTQKLYSNTVNNFSTATLRQSQGLVNAGDSAFIIRNADISTYGAYWWVTVDFSFGSPQGTYVFNSRIDTWDRNDGNGIHTTSGGDRAGTTVTITDDTHLTYGAAADPVITAGTTYEKISKNNVLLGVGTNFTTELTAGAGISKDPQSSTNEVYTVSSVTDDTHVVITTTVTGNSNGTPTTSPGLYSTGYLYDETQEENAMVLIVLDPEESGTIVDPLAASNNDELHSIFNLIRYKSNTPNDRSIPTRLTDPFAGDSSALETYYDSPSSGDFTAKFGVFCFAEVGTGTLPFSDPDLIGVQNPPYSPTLTQVDGRSLAGIALWTRQSLSGPLDFRVDTTEPNGVGIATFYALTRNRLVNPTSIPNFVAVIG